MGFRLTGMVSNLDTESIVKELMSAQSTKKTKIQNKITTVEWKQEKWKELNIKIYSLYTGSINKMKNQGTFATKKVTSSDETKVSVTASGKAVSGSHTIQVNQLASAQYITGNKIKDIIQEDGSTKVVSGSTKLGDIDSTLVGSDSSATNVKFSTQDKEVILTVTSDTTVNDFIAKAKEAGINASYDTAQKRFFLSSNGSGCENAFSITTSTGNSKTDDAVSGGTNKLAKLGLSTVLARVSDDRETVNYETADSNITLIKATNSEVEYNGATINGSTNTIVANGLTFNIHAITKGTTNPYISLTVENDTQAVYDSIKKFVNEYNDVLKEMNTLYYADSARGYDPLTEEQKEEMTDEEIKKWEDKIKDALLRRDDQLGSVLNLMKNSLITSVAYGEESYSLASFGISTSDYTEKGLLHIDGDADDTSTATKDDKLMAALEENPEAVMTTLTTLVGKLYNGMTDMMKSTTLSSALTFYNDKEFSKNLKTYKSDLSDLEKRLEAMEERYYKQFTAMETALSKLETQSSSLASLLGTSS